MNSRERRILHLFLKESGLQTASAGEGPDRAVVLYPEGYKIPQERPSFGDRRGGSFNRGGGRGGPQRGGRGGSGGDRGRY
jgi:spoIIIJ-associated protein